MASTQAKRILLAISGASGVSLGVKMLELLQLMPECESHLILTPSARRTLALESEIGADQVEAMADVVYRHGDVSAPPASGSFKHDGMLVLPCSIKSLSGIVNSYAENLLVRAADVSLKEGRPLLLAVREAPLHAGHLKMMHKAAQLGAVIFPPLPMSYARPSSIAKMEQQICGRMLDRLGFDNPWVYRWSGGGLS